jgi:hypothetical protein
VLRSELEQREGEPPPAWVEALDRQDRQARSELLKRLDAGPPRRRAAAALLREDVQGAALLAASTDDGMTYQLALRACRKDAAYRLIYAAHRAQPPASAASGFVMPELPAPGAPPAACASLTLERSEMLQPDDAWPALARLADAQNRNDAAATQQALYQLAQKPRQAYSARPLSQVLSEVVGAEPTAGESMLLMDAAGADMMTIVEASPANVARACRPPQLADANRRQLCEQVARRLPAMTTELFDAALLYGLEELLGLPHSPQAVSKEELARLQADLRENGMYWVEEPSCANFARAGQHAVMRAREGELAFGRARQKARAAASAPR